LAIQRRSTRHRQDSYLLIFPFSGLDKIINRQAALKQANSGILPGGALLLGLAQIVDRDTGLYRLQLIPQSAQAERQNPFRAVRAFSPKLLQSN
jgi:hypothetical protein